MSKDFSKFKFEFKLKVTNKCRTRAPADIIHNNQKLTKLVIGQVIQNEDNSFRVIVRFGDYKNRLSSKVKLEQVGTTDLTLHITYQSFECKDKLLIFTRYGQRDRRYICISRFEDDKVFKNVDNNRFVPFCHNWLVRGWIVIFNNKLYFHFYKCITIVGYDYNIRHWIDDDKFYLNGKWYY